MAAQLPSPTFCITSSTNSFRTFIPIPHPHSQNYSKFCPSSKWSCALLSNFRPQKAAFAPASRLHFERDNLLDFRPRAGKAEAVDSSNSLQMVAITWSAADVVKEFYAGINRRDLDFVRDLIAEDCVYEDLVFPKPFVGRQAILEFFTKFTDAVGSDLQFVIDDISTDDSFAVGVAWHLEWREKPFPFSKGCSFYRCTISNGKRQISYGRDSVEPFAKPGDFALVAIRGVTSLLERFPFLVDKL